MTNLDIQQAKEWAESRAYGNYALSEETLAAVKVIQSLPSQWLDAEELREFLTEWRKGLETSGANHSHEILDDLEETLFGPPLPTLADMTFEELKGYIGEKVTVDGWANPTRLVSVIGDEGAVLAHRLNVKWPFVEVRPLSDLAPVAAPEQEAEDTPEPVQPRPEDVPAGEPWLVKCGSHEWVGTRESRVETVCSWVLARLDGADYTVARDDEITLISRMVPEVKP